MKAFRRFRLSPALVVACAALLIALGDMAWASVSQVVPRRSVGTAQLRNNAVTSVKIRNGQVRFADLARNARRPGPRGPAGPAGPAGTVSRLWAVVNSSGSIARSAGTTSAGRLGTGDYEVVFGQNVTACVFVATLGDPAEGTGVVGMASTARRAGNANGVRIRTRGANGALADRPFHLVVVC